MKRCFFFFLSLLNFRRRAAEASCSGHAMAVAQLNGWVRDFVGRASEGLYEREALLARCEMTMKPPSTIHVKDRSPQYRRSAARRNFIEHVMF